MTRWIHALGRSLGAHGWGAALRPQGLGAASASWDSLKARRHSRAGPTSALRLPLALLSLLVGAGAASCSPRAWRTIPDREMGFSGARAWVAHMAEMVSVTGLLKLQFGPRRGASVDSSRANGRRGVSGAGRTSGLGVFLSLRCFGEEAGGGGMRYEGCSSLRGHSFFQPFRISEIFLL